MITRETDYALRLLRTLRDGERRTAAEAAELRAAEADSPAAVSEVAAVVPGSFWIKKTKK